MRKPVTYERRMLERIKREGGVVLKTIRQDDEAQYTTAVGSFLRADIVADCIAAGFLVPNDSGLLGDNPTSYSVAER